jgi:transcriptional regulator with XRE-family HTH domain
MNPLKTYREKHKLTQAGLASELEVSRTTVARWESHTRKIGREKLPTVAAKTGIPAKVLRPDLAELMEEVQ